MFKIGKNRKRKRQQQALSLFSWEKLPSVIGEKIYSSVVDFKSVFELAVIELRTLVPRSYWLNNGR
jgi:hypothetical protein